jgi:hypothetical protein
MFGWLSIFNSFTSRKAVMGGTLSQFLFHYFIFVDSGGTAETALCRVCHAGWRSGGQRHVVVGFVCGSKGTVARRDIGSPDCNGFGDASKKDRRVVSHEGSSWLVALRWGVLSGNELL